MNLYVQPPLSPCSVNKPATTDAASSSNHSRIAAELHSNRKCERGLTQSVEFCNLHNSGSFFTAPHKLHDWGKNAVITIVLFTSDPFYLEFNKISNTMKIV